MSNLIYLLERLVFFIAGLVIVFLAFFSKSQAASLDDASLDSASSRPAQVVMLDAVDLG